MRVDPFAAGARNPQEITHEKALVGCAREAEAFVSTMSDFGDRPGPLLVQPPPSFAVEGTGVLEEFLDGVPGGARYAVGVRHRSWLGPDLAGMLRESGVVLTLMDYPRMPRMKEATADLSCVRLPGDRRGFPAGHTHLKKERDDLRWWSDLAGRLLEIRRGGR